MLIFALRRNLFAYRDDVREGKWQLSKQFCLLTNDLHDIKGSTRNCRLRSIGQAMARMGQAVGMRVLIAEHKNASTIRPAECLLQTSCGKAT
jgi:glycerate dehydrogenase